MLSLRTADLSGNPYPVYDAIRARAPVYFDPELKQWLITGYGEAREASADGRLSSRIVPLMRPERWQAAGRRSSIDDFLDNTILLNDPPRHTRLRNALQRIFTAELVHRVRVQTQRQVEEIINEVAPQDGMDVVCDFAYKLPLRAVGALLGIEREMLEWVKRQSLDLSTFLGGEDSSPSEIARVECAILNRDAYFQELIAQRRTTPADDLISAMAREGASDKLDAMDISAVCASLVSAGHETTGNLIANAVLTLLEHPTQMTLLRQTPELIDGAIEEVLRYESPVQWTGRIATKDLVLASCSIPAGAVVLIGRGAANRDPRQFAAPASFDIGRRPNRHLAFGFGLHSCIGAALARVQAAVAIGMIIQRWPQLRLAADAPSWEADLAVRALTRLPVLF